MFKFGFFEDDRGNACDGGDVADAAERQPLQEHVILDESSAYPNMDEVTTLSLCGEDFRLMNGDLVTARLEKQGRAGELARANREHTDLIPDVYEGGMKLWECARDLVAHLDARVPLAGLHVLELGCGAALPAIFCLRRGAASATVQDYNREVVDHVTVPNLRLNVPAAALAGCWAVSGDWAALAARLRQERGRRAELVLASETIYSPASWPRLMEAVDAALAPHGTALVAAKTFYFGVGGGTRAFEQALKQDGRFTSEVVFATEQGLHREILCLKRL